MKKQDRKIFASFMMLIATMLWGLSYCVQTISAADLGTYTIVFFKGIGALALIPFIIVMKKKFNRQAFIGGILVGSCAFLGCVFQQKGMMLSSVSKASFITVLYIVIVPFIEVFVGRKIKGRMVLAILVALLGLYFLCMSGSFSLNIGDLYLLLCAFFFALQIIFIDRFVQKCDSVVLCFVAQMVLSLYSFVIMTAVEKPTMADFSGAFLPIMYMVFMSGMLAQTIQIVYQEYLNASLASLIMSFESVFGALFGWLILHQTLTIREIIGCVLVFIAILMAE